MSKKQMLFGFAAILMAGAVAVPSMAASGGYGTSIAAPIIRQTNYDVTSSNWSVQAGAPSTGSVTSVSWNIGYTNTLQGTIQVKICNKTTLSCTGFGSLSGTSSVFGSAKPNTSFYFIARVSSGNTVVLSPTVNPSGNSSISVNYNY